MLEQNSVTIKAGSSFQTVCPFPVGYIYQSYNSTSPANIYGGSWTQITGRFLYCDNGTWTGGSNTHTLSISEMPNHGHPNAVPNWAALYISGQGTTRYGSVLDGSWHTTDSVGGGQPHNNMPAYQTCYAWRRTA